MAMSAAPLPARATDSTRRARRVGSGPAPAPAPSSCHSARRLAAPSGASAQPLHGARVCAGRYYLFTPARQPRSRAAADADLPCWSRGALETGGGGGGGRGRGRSTGTGTRSRVFSFPCVPGLPNVLHQCLTARWRPLPPTSRIQEQCREHAARRGRPRRRPAARPAAPIRGPRLRKPRAGARVMRAVPAAGGTRQMQVPHTLARAFFCACGAIDVRGRLPSGGVRTVPRRARRLTHLWECALGI